MLWLQSRPDGGREGHEVREVSFQDVANDLEVDVGIPVNQHVAEARHRTESLGELLGQPTAGGEEGEELAVRLGLSEAKVVFKHALRNALIPIVTLVGLYIPILFSGTVFIEYVFAWPGMGRMTYDAVLARDYPLVMAGVFFFALMVVVANLVADILYAVVDPRIRHE